MLTVNVLLPEVNFEMHFTRQAQCQKGEKNF